MGWIRDGADDHEGCVQNVLADGRVSAATAGGGVIVHELTGDDIVAGREICRREGSNDVDVILPWDQVVAWRPACQCGWTGSERSARTAPDSPGSERDSAAFPEIVNAFKGEWLTHVGPVAALHDLEELSDDLRALESLIKVKVQSARAGGASWTQIGRAARLSRQGAQQRWRSLTPTTPIDA